MSKTIFGRLAGTLALAAVAGPAAAQGYASVCISGPNINGDPTYYACVNNETGYSSGGPAQQTDAWGVAALSEGEYRTGTFSSAQAVSLSTGVMRSAMLYAAGEDTNEYQLGNYAGMNDEITFSGSGSAEFVMRLTGALLGSPHALYPNTMDTSLDFYSTRRQTDVLGRIHLAYMSGTDARYTSGTTCGWTFGLGSITCEVISLAAGQIAIDMHVTVNGITDGETFQFGSSLNTQAYGPRMGGSDFGHTARLQIVALNGVSISSSASGAFLSDVSAVPEPQGWALMAGGLGMLAWLRRRRNS